MKKQLSEKQIKKRLAQIGELLKNTSSKSAYYKELMEELDLLLGTEEQPRDLEAEEQWEKDKK